MAKQENVTEEVTGGLSTGITFGASRGARDGVQPQGGAGVGASVRRGRAMRRKDAPSV